MKNIDIKAFVNSYLQTAAWVTCESLSECQDFTREAKKQAANDCMEFIAKVMLKLGEDKANELLTIPGNDLTYLAPHCFYLNRCGHGTGFWDRENEFGEYANILSDISKQMYSEGAYHIRGKKSKLIFI